MQLPGPVPVRLPRAPRHALGVRLAELAHRPRRLGHLRRGGRSPTLQKSARARRQLCPTDGRRCADRDRPVRARDFDAAVIATHPDQALLMLDEPTLPSGPCSARSRTPPTALTAHRRIGASPPPPRPRILELPGDARRDNVLVTYDVTRLMRLRGPRRFLVTLGGHDRVDPALRHRRDDVQPPAVHTANLLPHRHFCRRSTTTGWSSPAPTTDGDSTKTARHPACAPPERLGATWPRAHERRIEAARMLTPALYRTRITHLRRAPVHHSFEHRGYSWYVDIDHLPGLPWWLRPFAKFEAARPPFDARRPSRLAAPTHRRLSRRSRRRPCRRTITALLQARVLGYVFNPLSVFWCHDAQGVLRHVVAEVHNTYGGRHAYLLPPPATSPPR